MKKITILMMSHCFMLTLFAQSANVDRTKIKTTIENLNKEMEKSVQCK